jgi:flagellar assembly protein FliH
MAADLGTVRARVARDLVIDPELVRDATDEGYRTGYNEGFTAGLEDAATAIDARELQRRTELAALVTQLRAAADTLDERHAAIVAEIEDRIVAVACEIAEVVVGHELAISADPGVDAIARCLHLAPTDGTVVAHLHPDDVATLNVDDDRFGRALRVVPDATLTRGDAVVDIGPTRIDGRIAAALTRIREVLVG